MNTLWTQRCRVRMIRVCRCALPVMIASVLLPTLGQPQNAVAEVLSSDRIIGHSSRELGLPRAAMPDVSMKAGLLITADGLTLWSRRQADRRSIASITKVMTAIVVIEATEPGDMVTVPNASTRVGEATAFLRPGERLPVSEMLEALLIKSGNDAAVALAHHISGSEEDFVALMNTKAAELGLTRTRFSNPHGLDGPDNYSTARDVAVLTRYAMTKTRFRDVVHRKHAEIGFGSRAEKVMSTNLLLGNYDGANGVKTGWTNKAGYSVVVSARRNDLELHAVVLGTGGDLLRFKEARELLDFGFAHYRPQRLATAGSVVAEAPVEDYLDRTVPAAVAADTTATVFDLAGPITRSISVSIVKAPVLPGDKVGVATFTQRDEIVATVPLVATEEIRRPTPLHRVWIATVRTWRWVFGNRI